MRHLKPRTKLLIGIAVLAVVLIALLLLGKPSEIEPSDTSEVNELQNQQPEPSATTETKPVKEITELCEDHALKQGEQVTIQESTIVIDRIARTGVLLSVDGQQIMLPRDNYKWVGDILLELGENGIFYFEVDDPENVVELRIGCASTSEEPIDKHVRERGATVCEELYRSCEQQFDLED